MENDAIFNAVILSENNQIIFDKSMFIERESYYGEDSRNTRFCGGRETLKSFLRQMVSENFSTHMTKIIFEYGKGLRTTVDLAIIQTPFITCGFCEINPVHHGIALEYAVEIEGKIYSGGNCSGHTIYFTEDVLQELNKISTLESVLGIHNDDDNSNASLTTITQDDINKIKQKLEEKYCLT